MHPEYPEAALYGASLIALLLAPFLLVPLLRWLAPRFPAGAIARRAALFAALWLILTGGVAGTWGFGLAGVALATALSLRLLAPERYRFASVPAARFLGFFLWQAIRSGTQVAAMALRPRLDLQPAIVDLDLRLPSERARLFLASTLSLLPGTLTCGLEGARLTLHVLDARRPTEPDVRAAEARVADLFRGGA